MIVRVVLTARGAIAVECTVLVRIEVLPAKTNGLIKSHNRIRARKKFRLAETYLPLVPSIALRDRKLLLGIPCSRLR